MHKLLVPVDGSENALRAVRYAVALAKELRDASISVLHVHEEPLLYGEIEVYVPREKLKAIQHDQSVAIVEGALKLLRESGVPFTSDIVVGKIAPSIANHAQQQGCDAIIMGTHGNSAIGNLLMGSVATRVVHLVKVPVTLVK
jgi:nucleotide-binding universal stress UspA family protein